MDYNKNIDDFAVITVEDVQNLKMIKPAPSQKVYVKKYQQNFTFQSNNKEPDNGVTVIGNWVMDTPESYKASWFASPYSVSSQAINLQKGYDYATLKKKPFIIDGEFFVGGRDQQFDSVQNEKTALILRSDSILKFSPNAKLKVIDNNYTNYNVLVARNVFNVQVLNAKLVGDRVKHTYTSGSTHEWGYGIALYDGIKNIKIINPIIQDMTGDGIYIGREWGSKNTSHPKNVDIISATIERVRRNGITLSAGENVKIIKPLITDVSLKYNSVAPSAAIDIEPEEYQKSTPSTLKNCIIDSLTTVRVRSPIQVNVSKMGRFIDVNFIGKTKLLDSESSAVIFLYDKTKESKSTKGRIIIDDLNIKGSHFSPNFALNQENFKFIINNLTVEKDITMYMLDNSTRKYKGVYIKNIHTNKDVKAIYNFDYSKIKPMKPNYYINYPVSLKLK
ncbi:hypothetical protein [Acinetobacter sp. Marseille-Q1618]|uniref:hypothetical protein n=1 Tax=Acinetobacter sp. Marseille-Q1618 TaxID=2697502 RepID=UPI00156D96EC|nr:hypothetical protein [Acinetobacter sp. Marseille-Q1618]